MSLPSLQLDDLTWDDLRLLAQRRIPAASAGEWTHHAPVDPGITLLELFAYLLDQQLFVLDQVPDSLVRAVLALLGESPRPIGIARCVLEATPLPLQTAQLPAGTQVRPDRDELAELQYTVTSSAAVLPVAGVTIETGGRAWALDASLGAIELMPADNREAAFDIVVRLSAPAPADPGPLALWLELDVPARIAPSWSVDAVAVPEPAVLAFARVAGGAVAELPSTMVADETRGLRRSGLLSVAWQPAWTGATELRVRISTRAASFAAPPHLLRIAANAVVAQHAVERRVAGRAPTGDWTDAARAAIGEQLDRWLPLSHCALDIPPLLGAPIDGTVRLALTRDGVETEWSNAADLAFAGAGDRQFTVDRLRGRLEFGDGYAGRVPAPASDFKLSFEAGGGPTGNLPAGLPWLVVAGAAPELGLVNVIAAEGGRDAEPVAHARARVAGSLAASERVVTTSDIRTLIETMPGLGPHRAEVVAGFDPAFPCAYVPDAIAVFVIPRVPRRTERERASVPTPVADPGALRHFAERLDAERMLATRIHVVTPNYRPVALRLSLRAEQPDAAELIGALQSALARHLDAVVGGDGEGWALGHPLRPSELVRVAQGASAEEFLVDRVAIGIDGAPPSEDCNDVPIAAHELVYLAAFEVRLLPPEAGGQP